MGFFDSISDFFVHDVGGALTSGFNYVKDGASSIGDFVSSAVTGGANVVKDVAVKVYEVAKPAVEWTGGAVKDVAVKVYDVGSAIVNKADRATDKLINFGGNTLDTLSNFQSTLTNPLVIIGVLIAAVIIVPPLLKSSPP